MNKIIELKSLCKKIIKIGKISKLKPIKGDIDDKSDYVSGVSKAYNNKKGKIIF